jgi:ribokinase
MKILVFGSINIDKVFSVDHIVTPGETISGTSMAQNAGGKGANQAAAIAKAGVPVCMAGKIGADGQFALELLKSYGVNTDRVIRYDGPSGQAIIQLDRTKQNSIVLFSGGNGLIVPDEIPAALDGFGSGDWLILQNEISAMREIMGAARERGMRIFFNPSPFNEKLNELPLDAVNLIFVNELEGAALARMPLNTPMPKIVDKLVDCFPAAEIILTAGRDGAYYGYGRIRERAAAPEAPVVDTTGAGDTFTGFYIAARVKNMPVADALAAACKAASTAVSRNGAMESIPSAGEIFGE